MSSDPDPTAGPSGPPWSIDVLADLQAGVYPDDVSARLRARIAGDAEAMTILAALDSTVDDLSLLPTPRMPERYALRLDAAIASESSARVTGSGAVPGARQMTQSGFGPPSFRPPIEQTGPARPTPSPFQQLTSTPPAGVLPAGSVPPGAVPAQFNPQPPAGRPQNRFAPEQRFDGPGVPAQAPDRPAGPPSGGDVVSLEAARAKRRRWVGGLGVAAAVVIAATITLTSLGHSGNQPSQAATAPGGAAPTATGSATPGGPNALELMPGRFQDAFAQINGAHSGPLTNPLVSAACYGANDIVGTDVLGVTQVTYDGQQASAVAVRLSATRARVVVVGLTCGVNGAKATLDSETVTR